MTKTLTLKTLRILRGTFKFALSLYALIWVLSIGSLFAQGYPRSLDKADFQSQALYNFWDMYKKQDADWKAFLSDAAKSGDPESFYKNYFGGFIDRAASAASKKKMNFKFDESVSTLDKALLYLTIYRDASFKAPRNISIEFFGASKNFGTYDKTFSIPLPPGLPAPNEKAFINIERVSDDTSRVTYIEEQDLGDLGTREFTRVITYSHKKDLPALKEYFNLKAAGVIKSPLTYTSANNREFTVAAKISRGLQSPNHKVVAIMRDGHAVSAESYEKLQKDVKESAENILFSNEVLKDRSYKEIRSMTSGKGLSQISDDGRDLFQMLEKKQCTPV